MFVVTLSREAVRQ